MKTAKQRKRPSPARGYLYSLARSVISLVVACLFGVAIGVAGVTAGLALGELAALTVLALFLTLAVLVRPWRRSVAPGPKPVEAEALWDQDFDGQAGLGSSLP